MERLLKDFGYMIKDWDCETGIGEDPNETFYSVWLKKPYVINYEGRITNGTAFDRIKDIRQYLKKAYKDEQAWENA